MVPEYGPAIFQKLNMPIPSKEYDPLTVPDREKDIINYIFKNKPTSCPLYVNLATWEKISGFEKNLYLIGLVLEYSTSNIDNIALLKNNFENNYALDYIKNSFEYDISSELVDGMNINYLPGIFKLYEHYSLSGDLNKAKRMKELGLIVAQKGGQEWLDKATQLLK